MRLTDLFVRRPVLSIVVSAFILLLGLRAAFELPVRQYPRTVNAFIQVDTTYYGADPDVVAGFITTPLENAIAQIDGVDYLTSTSQSGSSEIDAYLRLNHDPDRALTEIQAQVNSVSNQLPPGSQVPVIKLRSSGNNGSLIMGFRSTVLTPQQVTDYIVRVVQPQLQAISGVQVVHVWGAQNFALRTWLDPHKLAAYGLTGADISNALTANSYVTGAGSTLGEGTSVTLGLTTGLHSADEYRRLVVKQKDGAIVRLGDVADVQLGADDYSTAILNNGKPAIFVEVETVPTANVLEVTGRVRQRFQYIAAHLPAGMEAQTLYDVTEYVTASIHEVIKTLIESLVIVTLVVVLFLRSVRASLIPVVTIPLSLVGTFGMMWAFGFSINLLTLLAMVLATGLVVDDAIIVVENVAREMSEGASPLEAALRSARALTSPIIAMTVVLIAVYVPIALRSGITGALFTEFALTLVGSVTVSAVLALTLSPMMCRVLLRPSRKSRRAEGSRGPMQRAYARVLSVALTLRPLTVALGLAILASSFWLYSGSRSELAPGEDDGFIIENSTVPATATLDALRRYEPQMNALLDVPEARTSWLIEAPGQVNGGVQLKPWDQRTRTTAQVLAELQQRAGGVAGQSIAFFQTPPLPGSFGGLPVSYVLKTTRPFDQLDGLSQAFVAEARKTGLFAFVDRDLKIDLPQSVVTIDRNRVAALGLDMTRVGSVLNTMLSGGYVNYFDMQGRSYKVIPEVQRRYRLNPAQLGNYTIADMNGVPVPLSAVAHIENRVIPETINHFQQMNAATISAVPLPGVNQAEALRAMDAIAARILPADTATDASGSLRQFEQESSGFAATFGLAVLVIYLSLAALFGSFRDPLIILVSVPMSIAGALLFIRLGVHGATLNIYTEVGLVTLMGLISKHGILMVEVANEQQALGASKREAILHAATLRLRPILMTTAAMVLGVMPLVFATGAGAGARFAMGLVIAAGLSIGTLFTLFVVPAFYLVLAKSHAGEFVAEPALAE